MNKEIKDRWVDRLFNGGLKQGTGQLRDFYGAQCCLDVLCQLAVEDGIIAEPQLPEVDEEIPDENEADYRSYEYAVTLDDGTVVHQSEVLPGPVMTWAGLNVADPSVPYGDDEAFYNLSELNDEMHLSFPELGELIRDHL